MATHCNTLRYTAILCNTLQHSSPYPLVAPISQLQHTATLCDTLQHCEPYNRVALIRDLWRPVQPYTVTRQCEKLLYHRPHPWLATTRAAIHKRNNEIIQSCMTKLITTQCNVCYINALVRDSRRLMQPLMMHNILNETMKCVIRKHSLLHRHPHPCLVMTRAATHTRNNQARIDYSHPRSWRMMTRAATNTQNNEATIHYSHRDTFIGDLGHLVQPYTKAVTRQCMM